MKMDLETLASIVEERIPTAKTTCMPRYNQIVVTFTNRPDVEIALITPWLQKSIQGGKLDSDDLLYLIQSVRCLALPQVGEQQ